MSRLRDVPIAPGPYLRFAGIVPTESVGRLRKPIRSVQQHRGMLAALVAQQGHLYDLVEATTLSKPVSGSVTAWNSSC